MIERSGDMIAEQQDDRSVSNENRDVDESRRTVSQCQRDGRSSPNHRTRVVTRRIW